MAQIHGLPHPFDRSLGMGFIGFNTAAANSPFRTQVMQEFEAKTGLSGEEASLAYGDYAYDTVLTFGE